MMSQESMMKKKLENMHLKERIDYGYRKVITMMLIWSAFCCNYRCIVCQYDALC